MATMTPEEWMETWIARWHRGEGRGKELHAWLGLSWSEYSEWAASRMTAAAAVALAVAREAPATRGGDR